MKDDNLKIIDGLDLNKLRHEVLRILSKQRYTVEMLHHKKEVSLGVSFNIILSELKISRAELYIVTAKLYEEEEIEYYNNGFMGLYSKRKGVSSFYDKKYLNLNTFKLRNTATFYSNIIIPILFLIITLYTLSKSENRVDEYYKELQRIVKIAEKNKSILDSVENHTKNMGNDSSKTE